MVFPEFKEFFVLAIVLYIESHYIIPFVAKFLKIEEILSYFLVVGLGCFLPLIIRGLMIISKERVEKNLEEKKLSLVGYLIKRTRLSFPSASTIKWSFIGLILVGILSGIQKEVSERYFGIEVVQPSFMTFEPLSEGRYYILLFWFPYWILNILGEEFFWRGVLLPRQIRKQKQSILPAYFFNGFGWGMFHIGFGMNMLFTLIPILFILPYICQKTNSTWPGIIIHGGLNGPAFIAICFGYL